MAVIQGVQLQKQVVVTYVLPVEVFAARTKMESSDQHSL